MPQPIPQPPGIPLLGNVLDVSPSNTWTSLKKLSEKYGEIFQIKVFGQTLVFVASVALAEEICDPKRFRKFVGGPVVEVRALVNDALFTAFDNESSWGIAHRIIAPLLSAETVRQQSFIDTRDTASKLVAKWKKLGPHVTSPLEEFQRLDLEALVLNLFGQRLHGLEGPEHPVIKAMEDVTSESMMRPTRPGLLNMLYRSKFRGGIKTLREFGAEVVRHRKENPTDRQDLLAALLDGQDGETKQKLTDSQVIDEVATMCIGSSTSPCLLATAIQLLIQNPDVVARARQELDDVAPGREIEAQDFDRLQYVQAIVRESLRLSFAAPGFNIEPLPSESRAPIQLAGGKYQVAHDQAMIVVLAGVNRDPEVFEDALAFKPERMLGEAFARLPDGAKKWFGNGKRECIGKHYAWQFNVVVMATLLRSVDFEVADPEQHETERDGWFNYRPVGFKAKVRVRDAT